MRQASEVRNGSYSIGTTAVKYKAFDLIGKVSTRSDYVFADTRGMMIFMVNLQMKLSHSGQ
jgi:hypothetical protein